MAGDPHSSGNGRPFLGDRLDLTLQGVLSRYMGKRVRSKHVLSLLHPRPPIRGRLFNLALNELERRLGKARLRSRPYTMLLDATNTCNLRCPTCLTGRGERGRPEGMMSLEAFSRILAPLEDYLLLLEFNHWGEPLLNRLLPAMIRHAEKRGVFTAVSTNGALLSEQAIEDLLDSGPGLVSVSVDGVTEETHQRQRTGGRLDATLERMAALVRRRQERGLARPRIEWQFIVFRHNEDQMAAAADLAHSMGVDNIAFINGYHEDPCWAPRDPALREPLASYRSIQSCSSPWTTITVNWDGGVSPCCWGFYQQHDLGNLLQQGFEAVWNGRPYEQTRRLIAAHQGRGSRRPPLAQAPQLCVHCLHTGQPLLVRPEPTQS